MVYVPDQLMLPRFLKGSIFWHWKTGIISRWSSSLFWLEWKGPNFGGLKSQIPSYRWLFLSPPHSSPIWKKTCQNWNVIFFPLFFEKLDNDSPPQKTLLQPSSPAFFSQPNSPLKALAGGLVFTAFGTAFEFARSLQPQGCQTTPEKFLLYLHFYLVGAQLEKPFEICS